MMMLVVVLVLVLVLGKCVGQNGHGLLTCGGMSGEEDIGPIGKYICTYMCVCVAGGEGRSYANGLAFEMNLACKYRTRAVHKIVPNGSKCGNQNNQVKRLGPSHRTTMDDRRGKRDKCHKYKIKCKLEMQDAQIHRDTQIHIEI